VMPVMVERPELRDPLRRFLLEQRRVQTSVLYPAIHEFSAYRGGATGQLPKSELAARTELTLPLYPHLPEADQDRVVGALRDGLRELGATPAAAGG
jgi:dTDP-4-amino-4,6-dideoxygalactose transaminase